MMRWYKEAKEGNIIVGGNDQGAQENSLNCPTDLYHLIKKIIFMSLIGTIN